MRTYQGKEASTGNLLDGEFPITELDEVDSIMQAALEAYNAYQNISAESKATFLITVAEEIEALGDELVERAMAETGLTRARIIGERERTTKQLRLFATEAKKGQWVDASIDTAEPNRIPVPKPDLRKQLEPLGPVVVFGASNFPLAYSAGGGDTASALASGCSVVVKAHPAHPGASQLVANAIQKAVERTGMPKNIYQHVHDTGFEVGKDLVQHPITQAVGFTGSFAGGKALYDLASKREKPIPVFAEMGSINPVILLPAALKKEAVKWGETYAKSITLGCGQFCTNPGLVIGIDSPELNEFTASLKSSIAQEPSQQMLHDGISTAFNNGKATAFANESLEVYYNKIEDNKRLGGACLAKVSGANFIDDKVFQTEVFGPYSLLVVCKDADEMLAVLNSIEGQLTGTVIGRDEDIRNYKCQINALKANVGRIIFNGVSTGVEVCTAMNHGGPFPATTDARFTAVGADALKRFSRPVTYQNCPDNFLPKTLKNENTLNIFRKINGEFTKESL